MKWGMGRCAAIGVGLVLAILLVVLLAQADDPRATVVALWRVFAFPWVLVFGGMLVATLFDKGG